jgi:hypothetical protein
VTKRRSPLWILSSKRGSHFTPQDLGSFVPFTLTRPQRLTISLSIPVKLTCPFAVFPESVSVKNRSHYIHAVAVLPAHSHTRPRHRPNLLAVPATNLDLSPCLHLHIFQSCTLRLGSLRPGFISCSHPSPILMLPRTRHVPICPLHRFVLADLPKEGQSC